MQIPQGVFVDVVQLKDNNKPILSLSAKLSGSSNAVSHSKQQRRQLQLTKQPDSQQTTDAHLPEAAPEAQGMPQAQGRASVGKDGRGSSAAGVHGHLGTSTKQPAGPPKAAQIASLLQSAVMAQPKPASATLQDLCPEDKEKVAKLLKQVVELGQELQAAKTERSKEVQRLSDCNQELVQENIGLKSKLGQVVGLIKAYHHRLQAMEAITAALRAQVHSQQQQQQPPLVRTASQADGNATTALEPQAAVLSATPSAQSVTSTQTPTATHSAGTPGAQPAMPAGPSSEPHPQPLVTIPAGANISITIQHAAAPTQQPVPEPSGNTQQGGATSEQPQTGKRDQEVQAGGSQPGQLQNKPDEPQHQLTPTSLSSPTGTGGALTPDGKQTNTTHSRLHGAGAAMPSDKQLQPGSGQPSAVVLHGPKVVDARAAAAGTAVDVPVQDLHMAAAEAVPASPLLVHPDGDIAEAAASLLRWQAQQGLLPSEEPGHMGVTKGRVLRYDPAIGKHGAFYFADVPDVGSIAVAQAASGFNNPAQTKGHMHASPGVQGGLQQEEQDDAETLSDLASELTLLSLGSPAQQLAGLSPASHHSSHARRALYRGPAEGKARVHGRASGSPPGRHNGRVSSIPLHARVEARLQELRLAAAAAVRALPGSAVAGSGGYRVDAAASGPGSAGAAGLQPRPAHTQPSNLTAPSSRLLHQTSPPQAGANAAEAACARAAARAAQALLEEDSQDEEGVRTAQVLLAGAAHLASPLTVMPASSNESGAPNSNQLRSHSSAHDRQHFSSALQSQSRAAGLQYRRGTVDSSDDDVRDTARSRVPVGTQRTHLHSGSVLGSNPTLHTSGWQPQASNAPPGGPLQEEHAAVAGHRDLASRATTGPQQIPDVIHRVPRAASRLLSPERLLHALGSQARVGSTNIPQGRVPTTGKAAAASAAAWAAHHDEDVLARTGFEESLVDLLHEVDAIEQQLRGDTAASLDNGKEATLRPHHPSSQSHQVHASSAYHQKPSPAAQQHLDRQESHQGALWRGSRYGQPSPLKAEPSGQMQNSQLRAHGGPVRGSMGRYQGAGSTAGGEHATVVGPRLSVEDWLDSNVYEENDVVMSILEQEADT